MPRSPRIAPMFWWFLIAAAAAAGVYATSALFRKKRPPPESPGNSKAVSPRKKRPEDLEDSVVCSQSTGNSKAVSPRKNRPKGASSTLFALLILRAASDHTRNFVCSPYSLGTAMAILLEGSRGETQEQLRRLLGGTMTPSDISALFSYLTSVLSETNDVVETRVANGFFIDKGFEVKQEYQKRVENAFKANVRNIDFKDGEAAAKRVNSFVTENTGGVFSRLMDSNQFADAVAVMINAVYFKGSWANPFDESRTKTGSFHGVAGDREERFMKGTKSARYSLNDNLAVVSIPYGVPDIWEDPYSHPLSYALLVAMPTGDFGEWREKLTADTLNSILDSLKTDYVKIELPKFAIESTTDAKGALQKSGVDRIFTMDAELSGISGQKVVITDVNHTAKIEVSEDGTTAAAVTIQSEELGNVPTPKIPPNIKFTRPFLFCILKESDIIFCGQFV